MTQTTIRARRSYAVTGHVGRKLTRAQELTAEINRLKAELDPLRDEILNHLNKRDLDTIKAGDFQAIRKTRHKWTYTASTEREMLALRNLQKWEQQQGTAIDNPTVYLQLGDIK